MRGRCLVLDLQIYGFDHAPMRLSIIVPVLNEAQHLPGLLADLRALTLPELEIIVVDGGSSDATPGLAAQFPVTLVTAPRGRALQMNAGARVAAGPWLWFLHADSRVTPELVRALLAALETNPEWGRCATRFTGAGLGLRLVAFLMNLRSCVTGIATGDQGLFMRRDRFAAVGGFPEQALMEDIAISRTLKRSGGRPLCLRATLITSSRRWETRGLVRTILLMWWLRLSYWLGADPETLARRYR